MKNLNLNEVEESQEFPTLKAGAYVVKIMNVEDVVASEYLKISFDIAQGENQGYYMNLYKAVNFWGGSFIRSYKAKALPFFKKFVTRVERSNRGYKWDNDEQKLKGKLLGVVLQEEAYLSKDYEEKTRLIVADVYTVDEIKNGDYKLKPKKELPADKKAVINAVNGNDIEIEDIDIDDIEF